VLTKDDLIAFEDEIAVLFNAGKIKAPVHLAGGNEDQLIRIFRGIEPDEWVFSSWRSHYHCLLKGVPRERVTQAICDGRSIALCFPEQRVVSSAIVGGICPIAVGVAWAIKRAGGQQRVFIFIGDMTAETGIYHECAKYAARHGLPIRFIVENNDVSVATDTQSVWGPLVSADQRPFKYHYDLTRPHVGTGTWVAF